MLLVQKPRLLSAKASRRPKAHYAGIGGYKRVFLGVKMGQTRCLCDIFKFSKHSSISGVHSQFTSFFNNLLILSVFLERLFMNLDKYWIETRKIFNSFAFLGACSFVIASVLSHGFYSLLVLVVTEPYQFSIE